LKYAIFWCLSVFPSHPSVARADLESAELAIYKNPLAPKWAAAPLEPRNRGHLKRKFSDRGHTARVRKGRQIQGW
jgi:hypothetical protein